MRISTTADYFKSITAFELSSGAWHRGAPRTEPYLHR